MRLREYKHIKIIHDIDSLIDDVLKSIDENDLYPITLCTNVVVNETFKCLLSGQLYTEKILYIKLVDTYTINKIDIQDKCINLIMFIDENTNIKSLMKNSIIDFIKEYFHIDDYSKYISQLIDSDFLKYNIYDCLPDEYKTLIDYTVEFNELQNIYCIEFIEKMLSSFIYNNQQFYKAVEENEKGLYYLIDLLCFIHFNNFDNKEIYIEYIKNYIYKLYNYKTQLSDKFIEILKH